MAYSKFSLDAGLDGPAFEDSTPQVTRPDHIMLLQEETDVDAHISQTPPGSPAPQEKQEEEAPENSVLKCMMEDASDHLHAFQEYEHYSFDINSGSDCEVPEEELTDETEDLSSDEVIPEIQLDVKVQTPEAFDQVEIN